MLYSHILKGSLRNGRIEEARKEEKQVTKEKIPLENGLSPTPYHGPFRTPLLSWGNAFQEKKEPYGLPATVSIKELEVAPTRRKEVSGGPGQHASGTTYETLMASGVGNG